MKRSGIPLAALAVFTWASTALASDHPPAARPDPADVMYESSLGGVVTDKGVPLAVRLGYRVYSKWCSGCHAAHFTGPGGGDHSGGVSPMDLYAGTYALQERYQGSEPAVLTQRTDLSAALITYYVRHGLDTMPGFRKTEISDTELDELIAYLTRNHARKSGRAHQPMQARSVGLRSGSSGREPSRLSARDRSLPSRIGFARQ